MKLSSLIFENNKFLYREQPFTGIGFELLAEGKCQAFKYSQGIQVEKYIAQYFSVNKDLNLIDSSHLIPEYDEYDNETEIYRYQGAKFSGIAYSFEEEFCIGESSYEDGWGYDEVFWYSSDKLSYVSLYEEDFKQHISWDKNGNLEEFELKIHGNYNDGVFLNFTAPSKLKRLRISAGAFSYLQKIKDKIKCKDEINFNFLERKDFAKDFVADSFIAIGGLDVNDEVFDSLRAGDGLKQVEKMILRNSSLSAESFKLLSTESNLKQLDVDDDEREFIPQALKQFKQARPDCIVKLNEQKIEA